MNWTRVFVDIFFLSVILCCISISQLITSCKLDFNHKGVLYYRVIDQTFRLLPHVVENQGLHRPCFSVLSLQGVLIWVAGSRPDPEAHTERASMFSDRLGGKGKNLCRCCHSWFEVSPHRQNCISVSVPGDMIYGRVMVDPVQNLGDSFYCSIEKVFLCTGDDGYVPKYSPENSEYGCLADSPSLLHRFKIVVRALTRRTVSSVKDEASQLSLYLKWYHHFI